MQQLTVNAHTLNRSESVLSNRNQTFDVLRLLFAIFVIVSHSWELLLFDSPLFIFGGSLGNVAVRFFFVISGYYITKSFLKDNSCISFIKKRTLRLAPAYIIALVLSKICAFYCSNYIDNPTPYIENGVVWTLYYEVSLYVVIMVLGFFKILSKEVIGAILALLIGLTAISDGNGELYSVVFPLCIMFFFGSLLSFVEDMDYKKIVIIFSVTLITITLFWQNIYSILSEFPLIYGPAISSGWYYYLLCTILLPATIIGFGKIVSIKNYLGADISYGVYLYAWPIQQTVIYFLGEIITPILLLLITIVIVIPLSLVSYYIVEKNFLKLKKISFVELIKRYMPLRKSE